MLTKKQLRALEVVGTTVGFCTKQYLLNAGVAPNTLTSLRQRNFLSCSGPSDRQLYTLTERGWFVVGEQRVKKAEQAEKAKLRAALRATTYQIVARGECLGCKRGPIELRFVYNPYGDDQLMCKKCGDTADQERLDSDNRVAEGVR